LSRNKRPRAPGRGRLPSAAEVAQALPEGSLGRVERV
jgi:hypothetical protein